MEIQVQIEEVDEVIDFLFYFFFLLHMHKELWASETHIWVKKIKSVRFSISSFQTLNLFILVFTVFFYLITLLELIFILSVFYRTISFYLLLILFNL